MDPRTFKRFVTEGTFNKGKASLEKIRSRKMNLMMSGDEVKRMYEEILEMPETAPAIPLTRPASPPRVEIHKKLPQKVFTKSDFFKSLRDVDKVEEILKANPEFIQETDHFHWTPLMMAACDGREDVCHVLLEFGADQTVSDGKSNTARTLALKHGHQNIIQLLDSFGVHVDDSDSDGCELSPFWCPVCKEKIKEADQKQHEASTLHQFNSKSEFQREHTTYGIPTSNRGFQIMVKQGWNASAGLGPEQKGRKYPVKTVLRHKRTGLGVKQKTPRVSHFAANDLDAVKYKPPTMFKTSKEMQRDRVRTRQLELRLRRELS